MWAELHDLVARIPTGWLFFGLLGQALFSARFLVQWVTSERKRQSVIPISFWWLSLGGGLALLAYSCPPPRSRVHPGAGIPGSSSTLRNLVLIRKRGRGLIRRVVAPPRP